jgi:hypothetical protein
MSLTTVKKSYECKLYYALDGVAGGTWVEVPGVKSVTVAAQFDEADVTVRQMEGNKASEPTLLGWSVDFDIPFDESDVQRKALVTAVMARTAIGIAAMSGGVAVAGSQGLKADMKGFGMPREEQIGDAVVQRFTFKPCLSATAPSWATIS